MGKCYLLFATALVLFSVLLVLVSGAEDDNKCGPDTTWEFDENTMYVRGNGVMYDYDPTNKTNRPWYDYLESIEKIVIGEGVTYIGSYNFHGCTSLTNISIADSVKTIGSYAFAQCSSLEKLSIDESKGKGVTSIEEGAFSECTGLLDTTIAGNVSSIGGFAFYGCENLDVVKFGDNVVTIGEGAFSSCSSLENLVIPNSCKTIENNAFSDCENLQNIIIPDSVTSIGAYAFSNCLVENLNIPESVTSIGIGAFEKCLFLSQVFFEGNSDPSSNFSIFGGCDSLDTLCVSRDYSLEYFGGRKVNAISETCRYYQNMFDRCYKGSFINGTLVARKRLNGTCTGSSSDSSSSSSSSSISKPESASEKTTQSSNGLSHSGECGDSLSWSLNDDGILTVSGSGDMWNFSYSEHPGWYEYKNSIKSVVIKNGVTSVGDYSFDDYGYLSNVTISDTVELIGSYGFNHAKFTKLVIPGNVKKIGSSAFAECHELTDLTISDGVISLGEGAFCHCRALTNVFIPASVKFIEYSFCGLKSVSSFTVDKANEYFTSDDGVLYDINITTVIHYPNMRSNTNYTTPATLKSIGMAAFLYCDKLTSVTITDSVKSIEYWAFSFCSGLISVHFGKNVEYIAECAFQCCENLIEAFIPASVEFIGFYAFGECENLRSIEVEKGNMYYSSIDGALYNYNQTTLIQYPSGKNSTIFVIPDSVISFEDDALSYMVYLEYVVIPENVVSINFNGGDLKAIFYQGSEDINAEYYYSSLQKTTICVSPNYTSSSFIGINVSSSSPLCQSFQSMFSQCYKGVYTEDGMERQKTINASKWENQTDGCVKYQCDLNGPHSWSICNSSDGINRECINGACVELVEPAESSSHITCADGQYKSYDKCYPCSSVLLCATCSNAISCDSCNEGFILDSNGICKRNCTSLYGEGCSQCTSKKCLVCSEKDCCQKKKFYWNATLHICQNPDDVFGVGCMETDGEKCTLCTAPTCCGNEQFFNFVNSTCEDCSTFDQDCHKCSVAGCISCGNNKVVNNYGHCISCTEAFGEGCKSCNQISCLSVESSEFTIVGTMAKSCKKLFGDKCQDCNSSSCKTCSGDDYKVIDGYCRTCSEVFGATCSDCNSSHCIACKDNSLSLLNGVCADCAIAFGEGCNSCNETSCTNHIAGYFISGGRSVNCSILPPEVQGKCKDSQSSFAAYSVRINNARRDGNVSVFFDNKEYSRECRSVIPNCAVCNDNEGSSMTCSVCENGYVLYGGICKPCNGDFYGDLCQSCSLTSCTDCVGNNIAISGICQSCDSLNAYCSVCSDADSCTECNEGFVARDGKCLTCQNAFGAGCSHCNSSQCTDCSEDSCCLDDTQIVVANGKRSCDTCSKLDDNCVNCTSNYCLNCTDGMAADSEDSYKCKSCSELFIGCNKCSSDICDACENIEWILTDNGCVYDEFNSFSSSFKNSSMMQLSDVSSVNDGNNAGRIVGIVIAVLVFVALIIIAIYSFASANKKYGDVEHKIFEQDIELKSMSVL